MIVDEYTKGIKNLLKLIPPHLLNANWKFQFIIPRPKTSLPDILLPLINSFEIRSIIV